VSTVVILGASARAAAFSALRAGLRPWCIDLFADADLQSRCPVERLRGRYPQGFLDAINQAPQAPWIYTGGLENWPKLVAQLSERRPLWGNPAEVLRRVRQPETIYELLRGAGLPVPRIRSDRPESGPTLWLLKPRRGAGGSGVRFFDAYAAASEKIADWYFQEYIPGEPLAAVYVAAGQSARLLGVTRQLVGEAWLHAAPFHYCGSLGPVHPGPLLRQQLEKIGNILTAGCQMRGLFGVDGVLCEGEFWPVEVNPRYTASVEVLEYGLGVVAPFSLLSGGKGEKGVVVRPFSGLTIGKAILFARQALSFPSTGPWWDTLARPPALKTPPFFADIPSPQVLIEAGRPILTLFAQGDSAGQCLERLHGIVEDLERVLYP
jgi:uncharacterized protein